MTAKQRKCRVSPKYPGKVCTLCCCVCENKREEKAMYRCGTSGLRPNGLRLYEEQQRRIARPHYDQRPACFARRPPRRVRVVAWKRTDRASSSPRRVTGASRAQYEGYAGPWLENLWVDEVRFAFVLFLLLALIVVVVCCLLFFS